MTIIPLLLMGLFGACRLLDAQSPPKPNAAVVRRAAEFVRQFAAGVPPISRYEFIGRGEGNRYWRPRWKLTFGNGHSEIEMEEGPGPITFFRNHEYFRLRRDQNQRTSRAPMTDDTAVRRMRLISRAAKTDGDLTPYRLATDGYMRVMMSNRSFRGIRFHNQRLEIYTDSISGELVMLIADYDSSPPTNRKWDLPKERAVSTTREFLKERGIEELPLLQVERVVVQPNSAWEPGSPEQPIRAPYSRVAWRVLFAVPGQGREVWVDAENGKVVGGEQTGMRAPIPAPKP